MTNITEEIKKGACFCKSCKNVFQQNELEHKYTERFGQQVLDSICPYCGSNTYGAVDYPITEEELLFNSKFYRDNSTNIELYIEKKLENNNINNVIEFVKYFIEGYNKNEDELIDYLTVDFGTCEWQSAFEYACNRTENEDLLAYCENLEWDEYDRFSCNISKRILEEM